MKDEQEEEPLSPAAGTAAPITDSTAESGGEEQAEAPKPGWSRWQVVSIAVSCLLVLAGVVGLFVEEQPTPKADKAVVDQGGQSSNGKTIGKAPKIPGLGSSLVAGDPNSKSPGTAKSTLPRGDGPAGDGPAAGSGQDAWSPAFLRMGFSFFVGFAIGFLLRAFMKLVLMVAGAILLAIFGLQEAGVLTVHWEAMDDLFKTFVDSLGRQFESLKGVITGSLPQAGLGVLGLVTGIKRK